MSDESIQRSKRLQALEEIEKGKEFAGEGKLPEAKAWFEKSLATMPTAEGYTFHAWALSFEQRFDEAIRLCLKAIELDPDFGNPYNDIGAYYIAKGSLDDAIPWLERAKRAPHYEPRHFPFSNLARIYFYKGWIKKAESELLAGLELSPESNEMLELLEQLRISLQ